MFVINNISNNGVLCCIYVCLFTKRWLHSFSKTTAQKSYVTKLIDRCHRTIVYVIGDCTLAPLAGFFTVSTVVCCLPRIQSLPQKKVNKNKVSFSFFFLGCILHNFFRVTFFRKKKKAGNCFCLRTGDVFCSCLWNIREMIIGTV